MFDIEKRIKELKAKGLDDIQVYEMLLLELERDQKQRRVKRYQKRMLLERARKARTFCMN